MKNEYNVLYTYFGRIDDDGTSDHTIQVEECEGNGIAITFNKKPNNSVRLEFEQYEAIKLLHQITESIYYNSRNH